MPTTTTTAAELIAMLKRAEEITTGDHSLVLRYARPTERDEALRALEAHTADQVPAMPADRVDILAARDELLERLHALSDGRPTEDDDEEDLGDWFANSVYDITHTVGDGLEPLTTEWLLGGGGPTVWVTIDHARELVTFHHSWGWNVALGRPQESCEIHGPDMADHRLIVDLAATWTEHPAQF